MASSKFGGSFTMASDKVYDHTCTPCTEDGQNAEASSYCTNCAKKYCDQCSQSHNRLLKNHMVLGTKDVKDWGGIDSTSFDMCQSHKGKQLEMLCRDHDQLCCTICISVSHRSCKTVDHLPDVAKGIRNNAEFKALPKTIAKFEAHVNTLKAGKKKNQKALKESCKTIRSTVNQLKKKLVSLLDDREKETIHEMDKLYATFDKAIQAEIDSCEAIRADLQKLLDNLQDKEEETAIFIGYRKCQDKLAEAENAAKNISTQDYSFLFKVDTEIEKCISTLNMLGQFDVYFVVDKKKHNISLKTDKQTCGITGCCVLPSGDIFLVDERNETLKQLDQHVNVVNHLKLPRYPHDVCCISDTEVAVTVCCGGTHYIQFVDVANRCMKLSRQLQLQHDCSGLAYHKGQLYVSSNTALYIYTMTGQLVKKVYEDNTPAFFSSNIYRFVITEDDNIHIANWNNNSLISIDSEGRQLANLTDKDFNGARGICIVGNGSLFVSCRHSNIIVQVDNQGVKKMAIVASENDGLQELNVVCFSKKTSQLIAGQWGIDNIVVLQLNQ